MQQGARPQTGELFPGLDQITRIHAPRGKQSRDWSRVNRPAAPPAMSSNCQVPAR
jgi:hypothetical protein